MQLVYLLIIWTVKTRLSWDRVDKILAMFSHHKQKQHSLLGCQLWKLKNAKSQTQRLLDKVIRKHFKHWKWVKGSVTGVNKFLLVHTLTSRIVQDFKHFLLALPYRTSSLSHRASYSLCFKTHCWQMAWIPILLMRETQALKLNKQIQFFATRKRILLSQNP
jgi:hypothetical protein